tara:strand:- start:534 stop:731 length:198 start_codon:yes stop_codon:yes gene_type:complete
MEKNYDDDPEPQRYYDWMLWKMRQERKKCLEILTPTAASRKILKLEKEVEELKHAIVQLQEQQNR